MSQLLCRGCGAPIFWIDTAAGRKAPLDVKPKKVWIHHPETGAWMLVAGHESHHATCPKAAEFRKAKQ